MVSNAEDSLAASGTRHLAFSVDTHLLRELGALLVGRDSTAVVELIKNAYDADATRVVLHGENLGGHGSIAISDDGHGMTLEEFETKFLRIAGRSKEGGARRSPKYRRKYTGAKGVGRLSAHKLGEAIQLESVPDVEVAERHSLVTGVRARINWQAIEDSLDSIEESREIVAEPIALIPGVDQTSGTQLTIRPLHSPWGGSQLNSFLSEVRSTRPDPTLVGVPPERLFPEQSLLGEIRVEDSAEHDPGFDIELSGEFAGSESQWPMLLATVNWMVEIDGRSSTQVLYRITPSVATKAANPAAATRSFTFERALRGPEFVARFYIADNSTGRGRALPALLKKFSREAAGIRVFLEGFRVLPYGTPRNDWLGLDDDYSKRHALADYSAEIDSEAKDERTYLLSNSSYFGGAYLHVESSPGLEMVVNREGFLPNADYVELVDNIRRGVQLSVRYRAAVAEVEKQAKNDQTRAAEDELLEKLGGAEMLAPTINEPRMSGTERVSRLLTATERATAHLRANVLDRDSELTKKSLDIVSAAVAQLRTTTDEARDEAAQTRVLASLGTQIGAFVHEVNGILGQARVIRDLLEALYSDVGDVDLARRVRNIRVAADEMISTLERQAVYLSDSFGAETRRRRSRQSLVERISTARRLLTASAASRSVTIDVDVRADIRTPPMFAAEVNVVLTNLISNAVKAASADASERLVRVEATQDSAGVRALISNTGTSVRAEDAERWFLPFETTTTDVDVVLGQGLGLGLPLTRRIVEDYGGTVRFVEPSARFATAVEVKLPTK